MRRIDKNTVELTDEEWIVNEIVAHLLDQGWNQEDAVILIRGSKVPEGLRTPSPVLDRILTPEFTDYLTW